MNKTHPNKGDFFMRIRLGYACVTETLNLKTSTNYTYTNYIKEKNLEKLDNIIKKNLKGLKEILNYNIKNNIHFYRLSSKLIPLATKDDVKFDYIDRYKNEYKEISDIINKNKIRVDFHPDQFCVLNSVKKDVVNNSIEILKYHYNILDSLKIKDKILILHIGSNVFGKENSLSRFIKNYNLLPKNIKDSIVIENDDKIFNIEDCLYLNKKLGIPIVLDYHHHICNSKEIDLYKYIDKIFSTWKTINPKIHFSSPKSKLKKEFRSHNDYIDSEIFIDFIERIKHLNYDIDIMIEAKKKDEAMFRLIREIKYKTNYEFIDDTTFIV